MKTQFASIWKKKPIIYFALFILTCLASHLLASCHTLFPFVSRLSLKPKKDKMSGPFLEAVHGRRTWYTLNKSLVVSEDKIRDIVQNALQSVPTSFNSQSNRAVLLFGDEHDKAWEIVTAVLKSRVSEEKWALTEKKTAGFKAAAGTVRIAIMVVTTFLLNHDPL